MEDKSKIYRKYKNLLVPLFLFFSIVFVVFRIIIPDFEEIRDLQSELAAKQLLIGELESALDILNSNPDSEIDRIDKLTKTALPPEKDIVLIYSQLNNVANKSGVVLGGFSLKVGDVYSREKKETKNKLIAGIPFLNILIRAEGETENLRDFSDRLYKSIPLLEIKTVSIRSGNGEFDANFFFNPIAVQPDSAAYQLRKLSADEKAQLKVLSIWLANSQ